MEVGEEGVYRYTVTTRITCIKMGSDESHFIVSLIVRDKERRAKAVSNPGPSAYQPNALPLSQTGSRDVYELYEHTYIFP